MENSSQDSPLAVTRNPATGEAIASQRFLTPEEVSQALAENAAAFHRWRTTPMETRAAVYHRLAAELRGRSEALAVLITTEMGKPLAAARAEVEKCAATVEWMAQNGPSILADEPVPIDAHNSAHVSYLPLGAILGVMPWNFPLWQVIRASAPIMLSGNAFVLKHAPNVLGSAHALVELHEAAGFPRGLFIHINVDNDTVARLIEGPHIAAVTLTGSQRAGSAVAAIAGKALKKSLLELGGSDPFIVLSDADIDRAVAAGIEARFQNAGQVCLAAKRFILERPIAQEFTTKFVDAARQLSVGDPLQAGTAIGPVARSDLREELHRQVLRSIAAGARLLLGGNIIEGPGNFYQPTVLADVGPGMAAFDEETFGPVAAMTVADDLDHAIQLANTSDYGLSANLWTRDTARALRLGRRLETGGLFINSFSASNVRIPVGGVKNSGYGRELSHFGLREYTNAQTVWLRTAA